MAKYNVKQAAQALRDNPLLPELLEELKFDVLGRFPTAAPDTLEALQIEYSLAERFGQTVINAIHRREAEG